MNEALIAGAALLALAVLWYIFLRGGNGGCTAHHFGVYEGTGRTRASTGGTPGIYHYKVSVEREYRKKCQHEGCAAKKIKWRPERQEAFTFA